jgi:hypothetical protein
METIRTAVLFFLLFSLPMSTSDGGEIRLKQSKELPGAIAISRDFRQYVETKLSDFELGFDYKLKLKEVESGKELKALEWDKDWGRIEDASFSPDGKISVILCGGVTYKMTAKVFDLMTGEMLLNVREPMLRLVAFTPDNKQLVSVGGATNGAAWVVSIWDIETRKKKTYSELYGVPARTPVVSFAPDEKLVAIGFFNNLTVSQLASGARVKSINFKDREHIIAAAFSPDSKRIAAAISDGVITLFDAAKGKVLASFDDIQDDVFTVAFHPKENFIFATGKDKTMRVWDVENNNLVSTIKLPNLDHRYIQISTDGLQLTTQTRPTGKMTLWSLDLPAQAERVQKAALAKKEREAEQAKLKAEAAAKKDQDREARAKKILADLGNEKTRREAMGAVNDLGEHGKLVAPKLVPILANREERDAALKALVHIGKYAVPELIKGLDDKRLFVRLWCAHALGQIGPDASDAVPALMRTLSDASENVRDAARGALKKIKG